MRRRCASPGLRPAAARRGRPGTPGRGPARGGLVVDGRDLVAAERVQLAPPRRGLRAPPSGLGESAPIVGLDDRFGAGPPRRAAVRPEEDRRRDHAPPPQRALKRLSSMAEPGATRAASGPTMGPDVPPRWADPAGAPKPPRKPLPLCRLGGRVLRRGAVVVDDAAAVSVVAQEA